MTERWIYHFLPGALYEQGIAAGQLEEESLVTQGFIHFSTAEQIVHVANFLVPGRKGLVLLKVDSHRVIPEIRYENLEGGERLFPHVYGPVNLDAIEEVLPFFPNEEGYFEQNLVR